jgi:FKBP-type peptidyl-prolyl cis-trans isomerase 2
MQQVISSTNKYYSLLRAHKFENRKITFNVNNPLAGKQWSFNIDVIRVRDAYTEEFQTSKKMMNRLNRWLKKE